jgi:hypothetical protein
LQKPLACGADNGIGLVPEVGRELAMRGHHFAQGLNFFAVTSRVRGNLRGFLSGSSRAFEIFPDLLASWTRCIKVFLRVTSDLGPTASTGCNLVSELAESVGQLGLINSGSELLRSKKALGLDGARLAVLALR